MSKPFDMPPLSAGFPARGAWVLTHLVKEFDLTPVQASGIVGNLGGESGLTAINEKRPTVPGSRGGFGWAQWTGPRRRDFETHCAVHDLPPTSDEANYSFLVWELHNTQKHAIDQLKKVSTIEAAVYTFEAIFERPADLESGLADRIKFAYDALDATKAKPEPEPTDEPEPESSDDADLIRIMQAVFTAAEIYEGKCDGIWGPKTQAAYDKFGEGRS